MKPTMQPYPGYDDCVARLQDVFVWFARGSEWLRYIFRCTVLRARLLVPITARVASTLFVLVFAINEAEST